jgi:hypothetical protein
MKKNLFFLFIPFIGLLPAKAQNADLGIGGFEMPYAGATSVGHTIQVKADIRNFGFDDINVGCALVTISVPSAICSITGLNASSNSIWSIFSNSMPAGVTLRNTGGPLPADFEPYYIILDVVGINPGGPLTVNGYTSINAFQGGCMVCGNVDPDNDNATTSITVSAGSPILPLKFTGFSVSDKGCNGAISWTTAQEQHVDHFEVQQSINGNLFTTLRTVSSQGSGDHMYSVNTDQFQKRMYYRVMAVDIDNRRSYGPVQVLQLNNCSKAAIVQVYPIPASRDQNITMQTNINDKISYRLVDINGKILQSGMFVHRKQIGGINSGMYLLEMTSAGFKETQTIIVQ